MCLTPLKIKNPNLGHAFDNKYMAAKDCTSQYIYVPCGHCAECRSKRQSDIVQRMNFESKAHYLYFITLTYDNSHLPYVSVESEDGTCTTFPYADFSHVQKMLKRIRKQDYIGRRFRYIVVSEYGKKKGRPHFHMIVLVPKEPGDNDWTPLSIEKKIYDAFKLEWRVNVGTNKYPIYEPLYTYTERYCNGRLMSNFDCHYVTPRGVDDTAQVGYYVTKYIMKANHQNNAIWKRLASCFPKMDTDPCQKAIFKSYWNIIKPKTQKSLYFGLNPTQSPIGILYDETITKKIIRDIRQSVSLDMDGPHVHDPATGKFVPCSSYYSKKFMSFDEQLYFASKRIDPFTSALYVGDACPVSDYSMKATACRWSRTQAVERQIEARFSDSLWIEERDGELPELFFDNGM